MRWAVLSAALVIALGACPGAVRAQEQAPENPAPSVLVRPLASLIIPGAGQLMGHQDRGAVYIAAEVYLLSRYLQLDHESMVEARRFQNLAFDVARHAFAPTLRDTIFEYYEQMERFAESGKYDAGPGPAFVPESDPATYNGSVWLLARRTFWPNPDVPPDPTSPAYWKALEFYQARAIGPNFQWSWRNHSLEQEVFKEYIKRSDNAFRRAQNQVGLLLANHVLSAVDALISARMTAIAGHGASMRTTLTPGYSEICFSLPF